ncbi:MAG: hypothetical protein ACTS5I_18275, partial [Rhodanobacter sp.]
MNGAGVRADAADIVPPSEHPMAADNVTLATAPSVDDAVADLAAADQSPLETSRGFQTTRSIRHHLRAVRVVANALLLLALMYTITLTKAL